MTQEEWNFIDDQRGERKMFCEDFVDKKWAKTMKRRKYDVVSLEKRRKKAEETKNETVAIEDLSELSEGESTGSEYAESDVDTPSHSSKRRRIEPKQLTYKDDDMPKRYQHIRDSVRKIRSEIYEAVDKLKSNYHMSENQAEGAIVTVVNKVFGRSWKLHSESSDLIDLDTLPHERNILQVGNSIEALTLSEIAKLIMI
ncbi:Uncharacterised protein g4871 [Pycnogonum litorale]